MHELASSNPQHNDPLLARFFLSPAEKADKEKGKAIVKAFYNQQTNNDVSLNYFKKRNARWIEILLWAKGSQAMQEFLDYMNVSDANKAWVNVDTTQSRIAVQFIGTLVESMAKTKIYPCVNAIDDGSMNQKEARLFDALYRMHDVETIDQLQQDSGLVLEPPTAYVPDDELAAKVYFELEDRLPKEISFEEMLQFVMKEIKFERVANRKTIFFLSTVNFGATKIEKIAPKQYRPRVCIPTNMVYNFFMGDTGECEITQIGEFTNIKVKDFRRLFGKTAQNPDGLSEKEIFELSKLSTNRNVGVFNYMWDDNWALTTYNLNRPYDDCSILCLDCEIDFSEDVYYVEKEDAYGKTNITQKKTIPYQQQTKDGTIIEQPKPDNVDIVKKQKNTWMRGVYAPYGDKMLYWGPPDIIITPYTDVSRPKSSYTVNIPNNDGEYVPSLFERSMENFREYQLCKLKRKQLIAKIKPAGIRIDVESARNLDLGNGDSIAWEEVVRIYDQTGNELWSSKGIDPLQREAPPLSNTVTNRAIDDIIGLTNVMVGIVQEIRQLEGVPIYRDGSDVGDRTAAKLAEGQNQSSYNVTDFVINGNAELWEETFEKICLLHWNDRVKEEPESSNDMLNTRFALEIKMKSTEYQKQLLEADIQRYSQAMDSQGQPLLSPKDAMMLREIDNYKLACWYLAATVEQNRRRAIEDSERLQKQNAEIQQQSLQMTAQADKELQDTKLAAQKDLEAFKIQKQMELEVVKGMFLIAGKSESPSIPQEFIPIINRLIPNIAIPLAEENKQIVEGIQIQAQQEQQATMQQQMETQAAQQQGQPQMPTT